MPKLEQTINRFEISDISNILYICKPSAGHLRLTEKVTNQRTFLERNTLFKNRSFFISD